MRLLSKNNILLILAILSWIMVLLLNAFKSIFSVVKDIDIVLPDILPSFIFATFLIFNVLYIDQAIRKVEKWDVIEILWKLLVVGVSGIGVVFVFELLTFYVSDRLMSVIIKPLNYSVKLYAMVIFLVSASFYFKKLIFYQKSKRKVNLWKIFELVMIIALLFMFMKDSWMGKVFGMRAEEIAQSIRYTVLLPVFFIFSLVLSANVNWTAYLNFNQKLKSLFLLFIISLLFGAYFMEYPYENFDIAHDASRPLFLNILDSEYIFFGLMFYFPLIYVLFSVLVLIFNLPTSSVFEQRSSEIASFQRLTQSVKTDKKDILVTLLDASLLTSNAAAGWIETDEPFNRQGDSVLSRNIEDEEMKEVREALKLDEELKSKKYYLISNMKKDKAMRDLKTRFRSILIIPLDLSGKRMGLLFLTSELTQGFEEDMVNSLFAFSEQASVAVENSGLIREKVEFENYQTQVKIAKTVQAQILPSKLPSNDHIEFFALSQDAEEIGGDYYDVVHDGGHIFKVALGDISGKGTEAAFYMAQAKGMFQSLTRMDLCPKEFIVHANGVLRKCLQSKDFMTLTYLVVDTEKQQLELIRAGHCPTLYFDSGSDTMGYIEDGIPGLGILPDAQFQGLAKDGNVIRFSKGDLVILYTDGIVEAKNEGREEFGYDRLKDKVFENRRNPVSEIGKNLLEEVQKFAGHKIDDDYTILVIRFL